MEKCPYCKRRYSFQELMDLVAGYASRRGKGLFSGDYFTCYGEGCNHSLWLSPKIKLELGPPFYVIEPISYH